MSTFKARKALVNRSRLSSAKLLATSALTAAGLLTLVSSPAKADTGPWTEFYNSTGITNITSDGTTTDITSVGSVAGGNSHNLDILANQTVNVHQESSGSLFWGRADDDADPTQIIGTLWSNGRLLIIDRNGVFFGQNSHVDAAGISATTGDVSDADLFDGDNSLTFSNFGDGGIEIQGTISVADAGLAAFVSPSVINSGIINAKMGTVAFAAGETVTVDMYGDGLVELAVEGELADAYLENSGTINAAGGTVQLEAKAAKAVVDNIINTSGVITVASATQQGGKIVLSGGNKGSVAVSGTLDATGTTGGDIEVTGQYVQALDGAVLDASGANGGGTVHFGGDWQGGGDTPTSAYAYVSQNAILRANAEVEGDGGEVVVWSDLGTGMYGDIEAMGGANSGNGGFVEVSSLGFYDFRGHVDTTAANGETGTLLLDPLDILIRGGTGDGDDLDGGLANNLGHTSEGANGFISYTSNNVDPYLITEQEIETESATNNITIQARRSITTQTGAGLDNNVKLASGKNLTIETRNNAGDGNGVIDLSNLAFTTQGSGSINITGSTGTGVSNITLGNLTSATGAINVSTDNGNITLGSNGTNATGGGGGSHGVAGKDSTLKTTSGNINLTASSTVQLGGNGGDDNGSKTGGAGGKGVLLTQSGDVTITANDLKIGGTTGAGNGGKGDTGGAGGLGLINAQNSTVQIGRYSAGDISLGDNNGGMHISQDEIYLIFADELLVGNGNTVNITVDNAELFSQLNISTNADTLPPTSKGCENQSGGNPNCVETKNLALADTNLTLDANNLVSIIGEGLTMGKGWVKVDAPELDLNAQVKGKDSLAGAAFLLGDARLIGTQQLDEIDVLSNAAKIQQAIDFADSTAQKEIDVAAGTYTENLLVNKSNLKLDGSNATVQAASGANNALVLVTGSNVNIDPFIFDGNNLVDYGISASGAGANGLVVDGNTFRDFKQAGVYVENTIGGMSLIENNKFEGTSTRGVRLGNLAGATTKVIIEDNAMGLVGGSVINGVQATGTINGVQNVAVQGNTIRSTGNGVDFQGAITNAQDIQVNVNDIIATAGHGVRFGGNISNSLVIVNGNSQIDSQLDGVRFDGNISGGNTQVQRNTIVADDHGIYAGGTVNGGAALHFHDNVIRANVDGGLIGSGIFFNGAISDATVNIGDGEDYATGNNPSNYIEVAGNFDLGNQGPDDDLDGIHFHSTVGNGAVINIDGNRIGFLGTPNVSGAPGYTSFQSVADDGIEFRGAVNGNADVNITDNGILGTDDGIVFHGAVSGTASILIGNDGNGVYGNSVGGDLGNGIAFDSTVGGQSTVDITNNAEIRGGQDGIAFEGATSNVSGVSQQEINISGNNGLGITGGNSGIRFAQNVDADQHDIRIANNTIRGNTLHGINFNGNIGGNESQIWIDGNSSIIGQVDGIHVQGAVSDDAQVEITNNDLIRGITDDGIHFVGNINNATARINDNHDIIGVDNGIQFAGVNGGTVEILRNNAGITSNGHGIYFGGNIANADLDIHDNIINADANNNGSGDGIRFDGQISGNSTVNIGDGDGATLTSNASNVISGVDGIHFNNDVYNSAQIVIDGNRIGYGGTAAAPTIVGGTRVTDDGIEFADSIYDDATITVTDNYIRSNDDGVHFDDDIYGRANILIGGFGDKNTINANGDGIEFDEDIHQNALINISYNIVDAEFDGVRFEGDTSNADVTFPFRDDEILISNNDIVGGDNGIAFYGQASDERHDIRIEDNIQIVGNGGDGILHKGGIDGAQLWILDNEVIFGERDGVHIEGNFTNDATIVIDGNDDINTDDGDGIEVTQFGGGGGVNADITNNHVHWTGDNGIEVTNVDGVWIFGNEIHGTGANGIDVVNSDDAQIRNNDLWDIGDDGIYLENSNGSNIEDNDIDETGDDGIDVRNSNWTDIEDNDIDDTDGDGIQVRGSSFISIDDNDITDAGDDGIDFENGAFASITDNFVWDSDNNGIEVEDSAFITIDDNTSANNGDAGIYVDPSFFVNVSNNTVFWNFIGIEFDDVIFGNIEDNNVFQNLIGISLEDSHEINIEDNFIAYNLAGLWAYGGDNGYINVENNVFLDNPIHAGFNSGIIDFTNEGNTFTGGNIALFFDAWNNKAENLSLVETGGRINGWTYDGTADYQTFNGTTVFPPTNFGGTIGEQTFIGQSDYFVYVGSNTFVDNTGRVPTAIWLDGQESHYFWPASAGGPDDFITPSDTSGVLTLAQFNFLESMFFHYPDVNNRGIFFFGAIPDDQSLENFEDWLEDLEGYSGGLGGLNLTLTGLPPINLGAGSSPNFFANIAPAAGDETPVNPQDIEPAAGGTESATAPQDIEPAAGDGTDAACWADAVGAVGTGGSANYVFGGTFEESISDAATCGQQASAQ
jgi:parallel beta-helix repeat protein